MAPRASADTAHTIALCVRNGVPSSSRGLSSAGAVTRCLQLLSHGTSGTTTTTEAGIAGPSTSRATEQQGQAEAQVIPLLSLACGGEHVPMSMHTPMDIAMRTLMRMSMHTPTPRAMGYINGIA